MFSLQAFLRAQKKHHIPVQTFQKTLNIHLHIKTSNYRLEVAELSPQSFSRNQLHKW